CFFSQAEDRIRDFHVTGVKTCALPILPRWLPRTSARPGEVVLPRRSPRTRARARARPGNAALPRRLQDTPHEHRIREDRQQPPRSEERRVGKECRAPCGYEQ